jgi:hypothetical protein
VISDTPSPVLLSKISILAGAEEGGLTPAEFQFQCALPDDGSFEELVDWISCYFDSRAATKQ